MSGVVNKETGYGHDISAKRTDDLDKKLLATIANNTKATVLDLGCGAGGLSSQLAEKGAVVTAVDVHDFSAAFSCTGINFIQDDMRSLPNFIGEDEFDYCVLQRVLHYIRYEEALTLLTLLRSIIKEKLFVSVTGLETDIGAYYPCAEMSLPQRFCELDNKEAREKFLITNPVCLYSPEEVGKLLVESGWEIEELWVSAFGNTKAICK